MQITTKRLKEIIKEEMQRLDEGFGRHMAGATYDAARGFDAQAIEQLAEEFKNIHKSNARSFQDFIANSPAAKNIQPPREGSIMDALKMAMMPETEEPSYDPNDDQNRQMTAGSAEDRAYNRYDSNFPESKYQYQESRRKRNK